MTTKDIQRKKCNPSWTYVPLILTITSLAYTVFLVYTHPALIQFSAGDFLLSSPFISILSFAIFTPLYKVLLQKFHKNLLNIYRASLILSVVPWIIMGLTIHITFLYTACLIALFVIIYYYCFLPDMKIAVLTIRESFKVIRDLDIAFVKHFALDLLLVLANSVNLFFTLNAVINHIAFAEIGDPNRINDEHAKAMFGGAIFFQCFIFSYTLAVLDAVVYTYGASVYNLDSLNRQDGEGRKVEKMSADIATHYSYGVSCLGAMIMTLVQMLHNMIEDKKRNAESAGEMILWLIIECIVSLLEEYLRFITYQAYIYTAIYGKGLLGSGKMAHESITNKGFKKYFNLRMIESLLGTIGGLLCLGVAVVIGFIVSAIMRVQAEKSLGEEKMTQFVITIVITILNIWCAMVIGVSMVNAIVTGMSTCQMTIYVEDPDRFENTHPFRSEIAEFMDGMRPLPQTQ